MSLYGDLIRLCESIQALTGISVCIYDYSRGLTFEAKARDQRYFGHYCDFCRSVKNLRKGALYGKDDCTECDVITLKRVAGETDRPFLHKCHIGLTELILPIRTEGKTLGIAFLGQCAIPEKDDTKEILANVARYGGDPELFAQTYQSMPSVSLQTLLFAGNLARMSLQHIADTYRLLSPPNVGLTLAKRCESYIRMNYMLPITARSVSEHLHVNPSYLSRVFRKDAGMGLIDYIHEQRLMHAKSLLASTELPVAVIAENSGFTDLNYFSRLFRKKVGCSPSEFREEKRNQTERFQTEGESVISNG